MKRRALVLVLVALSASAIVVAGYAMIPDSSGTIHACYGRVGGVLRVIDPSSAHCLRGETAISWNQAGAQGPPGVSGYEHVVHQEFVPHGVTTWVTVKCSTGNKVFGGGFNIETPDDIKVYASSAEDGQGNTIDDGWSVMVKNTSTWATRQVTVSAICGVVS